MSENPKAESPTPASEGRRRDELIAKLEAARKAGPASMKTWEVGEMLFGRLVGYHDTTTALGPMRVATLDVEGKAVAVALSATLKSGFESAGLMPGDLLGIVYHGEIPGRRKGTMVRQYSVVKG